MCLDRGFAQLSWMLFKPWQPLAPLALCAMGGIVVADWITPVAFSSLWMWTAAVAAFSFVAAAWLRFCKGPCAPSGIGATTLCAWLATASLFFSWHAYLLTAGPGAALAARIPPQGCVVQVVGVVDEEAPSEGQFQLKLESVTLKSETFRSSAPVLVRWKQQVDKPLQYGDRVQMIGDLHRLEPPRNPGAFDSPKIRQRQGIYSELKVRFPDDTIRLGHDCGSPFIARAFALRHWMEATMALDIEDSPELVAMIQSMVLGSRGESLAETKRLFQYTGTMHLFAVSGMNVAMLAGMAAWLLQVARVKRRAMACIVIPLLWIYCYATGLTASSLRATVMASLILAGFLMDRPSLPWNTLGASTLVILLWNPGQLFTPGFQLSFGMVAFLMATAGRIQKRLKRSTEPDPFLPRVLWSRLIYLRFRGKQIVADALAVSAVAWIGSMPLTVYYFHLWSPSTIPANVFAVAFAWILLILGLASVLVGTFSHGLAIIFNNANWAAAKVLLAGISFLASIPGGHVFVEPSLKPAPLCEVEVLDIRGGGAIHLRINSGGRRGDWMVDSGSAFAFTYNIAPYLRSRGVNNLDGYLLTHGDSNHIGGSAELLREMHPAEVIDSPLKDRSPYRLTTQAALETSSQGKAIVSRGDAITLVPGITLHVLFPPEGLAAGVADDKAFVLRLDAGGKRILFTSDAGFLTESWLLENAPPAELRSDILVKQKHAKDFSGTPDFLNAVHPALIVASSTSFPREEQITEEWAAQVEALGIRLLRQDRTGAVKITIDASGMWKAEPFLKEDGKQ